MNIIQEGEKFSITSFTATHNRLPVGNYLLKFNPRDGFYLVKKENFVLPKKIYGDNSIVNRWITSWKTNSDKNMGILLTGLKGSGKTITAQQFCIDSNLPVIIIDDAFGGGPTNEFIDFITSPILGECIVFIDEFEKVYDRHQQQELLSLMDGNFSTRLVFLLTVNENEVDDHMNNRLNRIKYRKAYGDLDFATINEVIDDMLINKDHKESIYKFFNKVNIRTFDLLTNLIKEMNLFNEDAIACGRHLNLVAARKLYNVFEVRNGIEYACQPLSFSTDDDGLYFTRKTTDYINEEDENEVAVKSDSIPSPSVIRSSLRDMDDYRESVVSRFDYPNWEIYLNKNDYTIDQRGPVIILNIIEAPHVKLKLVEQIKPLTLVF